MCTIVAQSALAVVLFFFSPSFLKIILKKGDIGSVSPSFRKTFLSGHVKRGLEAPLTKEGGEVGSQALRRLPPSRPPPPTIYLSRPLRGAGWIREDFPPTPIRPKQHPGPEEAKTLTSPRVVVPLPSHPIPPALSAKRGGLPGRTQDTARPLSPSEGRFASASPSRRRQQRPPENGCRWSRAFPGRAIAAERVSGLSSRAKRLQPGGWKH